jgi:tetratricopeptide (TPR) repeat protein
VMLGQARAISGDPEQGAALIAAARGRYDQAGDAWGVSLTSLILAIRSAAAGDAATVAAMTPEVVRSSDAIAYDAFHAPAILLEAWLARQRGERAAESEAYRRALELSGRVGLDDHGAFALAQLGVAALADDHPGGAADLLRQAIVAAEAAGSDWVAAYARAQLGRALAAEGDVDAAEQLFRTALEWADAPRQHTVRESLVIAIAGDPATPALLGLADLADARGDAAAADEYRARAGLALT